MYEEVALNCIRYLDYKSLAEVDRLTVPEYVLLMKGVNYRLVDTEYRLHKLAWLTFAAKAEKKSGKNKTKPVYDKFKKFFNYEEQIEEVAKKSQNSNSKSSFSGIGKYLNRG